MPPTFDLQSHSIHSDGALPAADVIAYAAAAGTELVALTDHDTIDGVPEAREAAAHHGIAFSAAAELSAVHGAHEDLHILGYGLDDSDDELKATLHDFRGDRARRIGEMADRLRELGFELDDSPLEARRQVGSRSAGRTWPTPCSPTRRTRSACATRASAAATPSSRCTWSPAPPPTSPAAGRPSRRRSRSSTRPAASPSGRTRSGTSTGSTRRSPRCTEFADAGLDGVEAFYATHGEEETRVLHEAATSRGLLTTGSADFHGPEHERFNAFRAFDLYGLEPNLGPIGALCPAGALFLRRGGGGRPGGPVRGSSRV